MKEFFVGSKAFELPHILLILFYASVIFCSILILKYAIKKDENREIFVKIVAILTLIVLIVSRFADAGWKPEFADLFPKSSCALTGYLLSIVVLFSKKDSKLLYFLAFAGVIGGILTILTCNYVGKADFVSMMMSVAFHGFMACLAFLVFFQKKSKPTMEKIPALYIGYASFMALTVFITDVWRKVDYVYLYKQPLDGITWWMTGLLVFILAFITALIYEACTRKKEDQNIVIFAKYIKNKSVEFAGKTKAFFKKSKNTADLQQEEKLQIKDETKQSKKPATKKSVTNAKIVQNEEVTKKKTPAQKNKK